MDWQTAIEIVQPTLRIRWLCSEANMDIEGPNGRDAYRRLMVREATGQTVNVDYQPVVPSGGTGCCGG